MRAGYRCGSIETPAMKNRFGPVILLALTAQLACSGDDADPGEDAAPGIDASSSDIDASGSDVDASSSDVDARGDRAPDFHVPRRGPLR